MRACFADDWLKVREDGAGIARALGPAAKGLVPDLVILLDDGSYQVRAAAADALAAIGPAAEPAAGDVATLYRTRLDTESRVAALRALGVLERGGDADALLRQALRDDNATVAFAAAEVVHRRGGDVSAVFPRVRRELRRRSADSYGEALAAAELLAELGAKAARLLPELRRMRDDPAEIPEVRRAVARAVEAITGADQ